MSRYEHTDAKNTLIEATVEKIQLPKDLLHTWKRKLQASFISNIYKILNQVKFRFEL